MNLSLKHAFFLLTVLLIFFGLIYLVIPKYYFVISSKDDIPYQKCNKVTGKCSLTGIGEKIITDTDSQK